MNLVFCHSFRTTVRMGPQLPAIWLFQGVCEFSWVLGISVFLWWLVYLAIMYMKSHFPRAWMPHNSREISQIAGGSDPLRSLKFEICESEPYITDTILRIPLYCKFLTIVVPSWRLSVRRHKTLRPSKVILHRLLLTIL